MDLGKLCSRIIQSAKSFRETVNYHYDDGKWRYARSLYYSFIRSNTFVVFENILNKDQPILDMEPELKIIKPTMEELRLLRQGKRLPREFYIDEIYKAKECYVVVSGNNLVYIHWVFFKGDFSRFFMLRDGVAELNYNITLPAFRGRGLSAKVMAYISSELQKRGFKKVVGVIHENNIASIKCIKRAGFKETFRIRTLGQLNRKYRIS